MATAAGDQSSQNDQKHDCGSNRPPVIFAPPRVGPPAVVATRRTTSVFRLWTNHTFRDRSARRADPTLNYASHKIDRPLSKKCKSVSKKKQSLSKKSKPIGRATLNATSQVSDEMKPHASRPVHSEGNAHEKMRPVPP